MDLTEANEGNEDGIILLQRAKNSKNDVSHASLPAPKIADACSICGIGESRHLAKRKMINMHLFIPDPLMTPSQNRRGTGQIGIYELGTDTPLYVSLIYILATGERETVKFMRQKKRLNLE